MRFNRFRVCLLFLTIVFVVFWVLMLQLSPLWSQSPSASPSLALESPESLHVFLKEPLHVFLRDGVHLVMETNYWLKLLEQLQRPLIIHPPQDQNFCSNSVIVAFDASSFADKIKAMKLRAVGLLHYGDERGFSKTPSEHYHKFDFVFRTYYLPQLFATPLKWPNLVWIPNGPRSDSGLPMLSASLLPAIRRKHLCNFVGAISGNPVARTLARKALKESLEKQSNPCFLDITGQFGGTKSHLEYSFILRDSVFTLCVRGHSEETIRLYDALQAGSIPVVLGKPEFLKVFPPNPPFVFVESWDVVASTLKRLHKDRKLLLHMQQSCISYFGEIERMAAANMRVVVDKFVK